MTDDATLYAAWADGDRASGQALVARYLRSMARYFANKVVNRADADELVSETFERVARDLGAYERRGAFKAYLFGVAYNVLREYVGRHHRRGSTVDLDQSSLATVLPTPTERLARRRQERRLLEALRSLPLPTQIVLELHLFEQSSRAEIAALLGEPDGTVASRIRRGKAELHRRLEAAGEGSLDLETTSRGLRSWISQVRRAAGS